MRIAVALWIVMLLLCGSAHAQQPALGFGLLPCSEYPAHPTNAADIVKRVALIQWVAGFLTAWDRFVGKDDPIPITDNDTVLGEQIDLYCAEFPSDPVYKAGERYLHAQIGERLKQLRSSVTPR